MNRRSRYLAALAAAGALLSVPLVALADNRITREGGDIRMVSEDAALPNDYLVEPAGTAEIRFYDPKDPKGTTFPPTDCRPGQTNAQGAVIEVFCRRSGLGTIALEPGPGEDKVTYRVPDLPGIIVGSVGADNLTGGDSTDTLAGEQGNDTLNGGGNGDDLTGGDGDDTLDGGAGNDSLDGGTGADKHIGGAGDDTILVADGWPDQVDCGEGNDKVTVDSQDHPANCEEVITRDDIQPIATGPTAEDKTKPTLRVGGGARQRVGASRRFIQLFGRCSEKGLLQTTGYLDADGLNDRMPPVSATVPVGGAGAELKVRFNKRNWRLIQASFRHKRKTRARLTVTCVDEAGNTSKPRKFWVGLRR